MAGEWGWRLHWQDFREHQFGLPKPASCHLNYATKEQAEAARERLFQSEDVIVCVSPIPPPRAVKAQRAKQRNKASELFRPSLPLMRRPV